VTLHSKTTPSLAAVGNRCATSRLDWYTTPLRNAHCGCC